MGRALGIVLLVVVAVGVYAYDVSTILRSRLLTVVALSVLVVFLIAFAARRVRR
jgi:hypothetical protein